MTRYENNNIVLFREYYQSLPDEKKISLRNKITDACGFSISTFYYKLTNNSFKKLEISQVESICKKMTRK